MQPGQLLQRDESGTRRYWSWEQATTKENYDPFKADVFAAGISLIETLHGFYPLKMNDKVKLFHADNTIWHLARKQVWADVIQMFESGSYKQKFSEPFVSFLTSCLAKKENRITVEQACNHPWINRETMPKAQALQEFQKRAEESKALFNGAAKITLAANTSYFRGVEEEEDFDDEESQERLKELPLATFDEIPGLEYYLLLKMHPLAVVDYFEKLCETEVEGLELQSSEDSRIHIKVDCSSRQPLLFQDYELTEEESKEDEELEDFSELCEDEDQAQVIFEIKRTVEEKKVLLVAYPVQGSDTSLFRPALFRLREELSSVLLDL